MATQKDILGFIDAGREIRRPPLVGMQFLHQAAVGAPNFLGARPRLHGAMAAGSPLPAHRSNDSLVRQNETPRQLFGQTERRHCKIHCRRSRHSMTRTLSVK
jgi:hypothetical protein